MSEVDLESSRATAVQGSRKSPGGALDWLQRSIDRAPGRAFALLTVAYLIAAACMSSVKLLWLDELITLHIARLGSIAAIWNALAQGADPNPPISHILVHYSRMMFGDHELAYRLPAIAGYWVGLLSLFLFLRRRLAGTWALAGAILSMTMAAFDYCYESRSYAIFYGFAMLATLCWSVAADPAARKLGRGTALAGMIVSLAAGISTNYFAVLAFFPIGAGELARTLRKIRSSDRQISVQRGATRSFLRAVDWPIWIGLAVAATPLLAFRTLIAHAIAQFSPYAWNRVAIDEVFDSYTEMVEIILFPILALFFFAIVVWLFARQVAPYLQNSRERTSQSWAGSILSRDSFQPAVRFHEAVAVFTFMSYPILGYIVASIRGGMLSPRFVIPVCFGFAIAATLVMFHLFAELPRAGAVLICFASAWFIARESVVALMYVEQRQSFTNILDRLPQAELAAPANSPIVIPDPLLALTFQHYAPRALAARVVFPVDFPAVRAYRHDDSPEENLWAGRNLIYDMPIVPLATFQQTAGKYLIIAGSKNWLVRDLYIHHYPVRRLAIDPDAADIGGFTPLAKGTPAFYVTAGNSAPDEYTFPNLLPEPFRLVDNLPESKLILPGAKDEK